MNKTSYFLSKIFRISNSVSRAANSAFAGRMWPAGREFETPGLEYLKFRIKSNSYRWSQESPVVSTC